MNSEESLSMFGTILGTAVGWYFGGPMGGAIGGSLVGGLFGAIGGRDEQERQQRKLAKAQYRQQQALEAKIKRDNMELYSNVQSSVLQTSGAMGAVY